MRRPYSTGAKFLLTTVLLILCLPASAQDRQPRDNRTSENTDFLKTFLQRQPESDLNKDGVLTMEEAQAARRKMQNTQPNRDRSGNPGRPALTQANVSYGDHERNVLDFWQAKSDTSLRTIRPSF